MQTITKLEKLINFKKEKKEIQIKKEDSVKEE